MQLLVALDDGPSAAPVLEAAATLARLLALDVDAVHVYGDAARAAAAAAEAAGTPLRVLLGDPAAALVDAIDSGDVLMAAVGAGTPSAPGHAVGPVTAEVITRTDKPVAIVPRHPTPPRPDAPFKVVVPVDGAAETASALRRHLRRLALHGAELVMLHVFDGANAPHFWDCFYADLLAWQLDFARRNSPAPDSRLKLGRGSVVREVLDLAAEEGAALIALAWSQAPSDGHAAVVHRVLATSTVPVLLVPVQGASARRRAPALSGWS